MKEQNIYIKTTKTISPVTDINLKKSLKTNPIESNLEYLSENWIRTKIKENVTDIVRKVNSLFFYARVDYDIMVLEGVEEVKYPVETITDKKLLEEEIEHENNIFDLEEFYSKELDGAAIVITKDNMISVYSWIGHGAAVLNIYNYLDGKDPKESKWEWPIWQFEAVEAGNIIIQLCDKCGSPVLLPSRMNDYQYNTLMRIVEDLTEIDEKGFYGIELLLDHDSNKTSIKDAKDKINDICKERGIYDVPKEK